MDASLFHKRAASIDGLSAKCKPCQKKYDLHRSHSPNRLSARGLNSSSITYCVIPDGHPSRGDFSTAMGYVRRNPKKVKTALNKYKKLNPEKRLAHQKVSNAIRDGRLKKGVCMFCGEIKADGHHVDYSKPLDVIWLCRTHHKQIHAYEDRANGIRNFNRL